MTFGERGGRGAIRSVLEIKSTNEKLSHYAFANRKRLYDS